MYLTQPADSTGQPTYHIIPTKSFDIAQDLGTCRDGITWFKNSRDFAKEVRDGAIAHANKTAHDRNKRRPLRSLITLQSLQVELLVLSPEAGWVGRPRPKPNNPSSHKMHSPTEA